MKKNLLSLILLSSLVILSSCERDNEEPSPDSAPYFSLHVDRFPETQEERWVVITNGQGQLVGYKKIDMLNGDETVLREREAELGEYMNVYLIRIYDDQFVEGQKNFVTNAYLEVPTGQHWTYTSSASSTSSSSESTEHYDITIHNRPASSAIIIPYSGSFRTTTYDYDKFDNVIDRDVIEGDFEINGLQRLLTIHDGETFLYAQLENGIEKEYVYPEDFSDFDRTINFSYEGEHPHTAITTGAMDDHADPFLTLLLSTHGPDFLHNKNTIALGYLNGYSRYVTTVHFNDNVTYHCGPAIPESDVTKPQYEIVVQNNNVYSFAASIPAGIDHYTARYTYIENINNNSHKFELEVDRGLNTTMPFDMILPQEFIEQHGKVDFDAMEHRYASFYDSRKDEGYSGHLKQVFKSREAGPSAVDEFIILKYD